MKNAAGAEKVRVHRQIQSKKKQAVQHRLL
jgi:hypothetical protein